jgi:hypothetical protein
MKVALESGATIKMTEKGKGGLFVRGRKLTDKDLLECITDPKPKTKADCIRAMSDEELAELFSNDNCGYCRIHDFCFAKGCQVNCEDVWLDWLKQEADNGN